MINYTTNEIAFKVQRALENKEPLSIIRYGDGEARTLNGFRNVEAVEMILKKLLGAVPSISEIKEIRNYLIESYTGANIIGVPAGKKLDKSDPFWHGSIKILFENVDSEVLVGKEYVNMDFCYDWLTNGFYDALLKSVNVINYVSCRDLDRALFLRYGFKNITSYKIAPEMKFEPLYKGNTHYPAQFHAVRRWMKAAPLEGNLFLYGAGVVGKIYGKWAADYGAVAIDIGSIFDAWAGRVTRGANRGPNSYDETYKL